jgi:hypothetical protein
VLAKALNNAGFVANGSNVLLVQPGSALPILVLGKAGYLGSIPVELPQGFLLQYVIPSDKTTTIIVRTQTAGDFQQYTARGMIQNPTQQLLEVDPETGKVLRIFDVEGARPADITCSTHSRLSAIYYQVQESMKGTPADLQGEAYKPFIALATQ